MAKSVFIAVLFLTQLCFTASAQRIRQSLNDFWQFAEQGSREFHPAMVPGNIYYDLHSNGIIKHPYEGTNETGLKWVSEKDWVYKSTFVPNRSISERAQVFLCFEGLDTRADIYLNNELILSSENMFVPIRVDIKNKLKQGENELSVHFHSPLRYTDSLWNNYPVKLPDHPRVMIRKAAYQFGWDWAPQLPGCGIINDVYLEGCDIATIEHLQFITREISDNSASIQCIVTIHAIKQASIEILFDAPEQTLPFDAPAFTVEPGFSTFTFNFDVHEPQLWWPNGMGDQHLYFSECRLYTDQGKMIDRKNVNWGIRTVELMTEPERTGETFYFKINGTPVFIKGANYVPMDFFTEQTTQDKKQNLIKQTAESNINMLRIWGGGIYEDDFFYDLCDLHGIMIWQDFMFANGMYPWDSSFVQSVKHEVASNIIRLRNHPSIVLWCGNNEISEGWHNWGWQDQFSISAEDSATIWSGYKMLFEELIPGMTEMYDGSRPYWPSSPQTGWGREEAYQKGDVHYWGVWWGMKPFDSFTKNTGRFVSEYGFQALPHLKTLIAAGVIPENGLQDEALLSHQKHPKGFETINEYMNLYAYIPETLDEYILMSQYIQYLGLKTAIESHRRAMPYCMGSMFWQLNDCWPVVSWSSIDYYGRKKAIQFHLKNLYAPVMLSITEQNGRLQVWGITETKLHEKPVLNVKIGDFEGNILNEVSRSINFLTGRAMVLMEFDISDLGKLRNSTYIKADLLSKEGIIASSTYYPASLKDQKLNDCSVYTVHCIDPGKVTLSFSSPCLCRFVEVSYDGKTDLFDKNYFDIIPGETTETTIDLSRIGRFDADKISIRKLR
jgi:beta-mannosidase